MRIEHKKAVSLADAMLEMLREARISSGHNTRRIFEAWDNVSGAARYTTRRYFRDGILHITLNSSVARSHLAMQKKTLVDRINVALLNDELYIKDDPNVSIVKDIILK